MDQQAHKNLIRTTVMIDRDLLEEAQRLSGKRTTSETVDAALRVLVQVEGQAGVRALRGKLHWEGDLDQLREGRFVPDD